MGKEARAQELRETQNGGGMGDQRMVQQEAILRAGTAQQQQMMGQGPGQQQQQSGQYKGQQWPSGAPIYANQSAGYQGQQQQQQWSDWHEPSMHNGGLPSVGGQQQQQQYNAGSPGHAGQQQHQYGSPHDSLVFRASNLPGMPTNNGMMDYPTNTNGHRCQGCGQRFFCSVL